MRGKLSLFGGSYLLALGRPQTPQKDKGTRGKEDRGKKGRRPRRRADEEDMFDGTSARQARYIANKYPKSSAAALVLGTVASCGEFFVPRCVSPAYFSPVPSFASQTRFPHAPLPDETNAAAMVGAIEARDRMDATRRAAAGGQADASATTTPGEAQLRAMLENARESTWRENLENAADAQGRFMAPGRPGGGGEAPEYVRRIEERSGEILRREDEERRRRAEDERHGRTETRFW